jgi:hypothetical protein
MILNLFRQKPAYLPVPTDQGTPSGMARYPSAIRLGPILVLSMTALLAFLLGMAIGAAGFAKDCGRAAGSFLQPNELDTHFPLIERSFRYNRTFGADPYSNNDTVNAWEGIVPGTSSIPLRCLGSGRLTNCCSGTRICALPLYGAAGLYPFGGASATLSGRFGSQCSQP